MSSYTYILECAGGSYYTGSTKNIEVRLQQHQSGKGAKYTRARLPVKLIYLEEFETTGDAMRREIEIKKWNRRKKEELIVGNFDNIKNRKALIPKSTKEKYRGGNE